MFYLRFTFALLIGIIMVQVSQGQSQLTQKQIEKENYQEVLGFYEHQSDSLKPDVFPKYPNGQEGLIKDISKNIIYPSKARKKGIQGEVQVSFVVGKDGIIQHIEVMNGADPLLDEEAIRIIGELKPWVPGIKNGKVIAVSYVYPITFKLQ